MPSDTVPGATEDPYRRLGLRPFINCCCTRTVHGGSLMAPQVVEAMARAATRFLSMAELMAAACARIAHLARAPAALVTSGCARHLRRGGVADRRHRRRDDAWRS